MASEALKLCCGASRGEGGSPGWAQSSSCPVASSGGTRAHSRLGRACWANPKVTHALPPRPAPNRSEQPLREVVELPRLACPSLLGLSAHGPGSGSLSPFGWLDTAG